MKKQYYIMVIVVVFLICFLAVLSSKQQNAVELDSGYRRIMGTLGRIVVVAEDAETARKCIEQAFEELGRIEARLSFYRQDSEVSIVNRDAYAQPVRLSRETFEVLQKAIEYSKISGGAFDVTIAPLKQLWFLSADSNTVPAEEQLKQACSKVGYDKVRLNRDELTVRFKTEGVQIDLGGLAKGYGIDKAIEAIENGRAIGAMVDIGGDIRCFGRRACGGKWRIGLQRPGKSQPIISGEKPVLVLRLENAAVATSGNYRRFAMINGHRYSHIFEPATGLSAAGLSSVSVICKKAVDADALATAVSVMGQEKGLQLIESLPNTEAILIPAQEKTELIKTSGMTNYLP